MGCLSVAKATVEQVTRVHLEMGEDEARALHTLLAMFALGGQVPNPIAQLLRPVRDELQGVVSSFDLNRGHQTEDPLKPLLWETFRYDIWNYAYDPR
jgi:hypothetical protein